MVAHQFLQVIVLGALPAGVVLCIGFDIFVAGFVLAAYRAPTRTGEVSE